MATQNISKTTKLQINPKRSGTNAGARGGSPVGFQGGKKGSKTGQGRVGTPRSTAVSVGKAGNLNLGSNR